jgi:hypothetical protein
MTKPKPIETTETGTQTREDFTAKEKRWRTQITNSTEIIASKVLETKRLEDVIMEKRKEVNQL